MKQYQSTKVIELGSCAFRQWRANHSHCRFLHGYQLKAKIWFNCADLDNKNWVVDFGGLKELKQILQHQFDHTTVVALDDPHLELFKRLDAEGVIQLRVLPLGVGIERAAEWVFITANTYVREMSDDRCWVDRVEVFGHDDNSALYKEVQYIGVGLGEPNEAVPVLINETKTGEPTEDEKAPASTGAPVGNQVTAGKSGWFAGTRFG